MLKFILLLALLLAATAEADDVATFSWTPPTATEDGSPLTGNNALTHYKIFINGIAVVLDPDVTEHPVPVADGEYVKGYVRACNKAGCSERSRVLEYTGGTGEGPPPNRPGTPLNFGIEVEDAGPIAPPDRVTLLSTTVAGNNPETYGRPTFGATTGAHIDGNQLSGGVLISLYPFRIRIVTGYVSAEWNHSQSNDNPDPLVSTQAVDPNGETFITFYCDANVWTLEVNGVLVEAPITGRCASDTWGSLQIGAAGGTADTELYDLP